MHLWQKANTELFFFNHKNVSLCLELFDKPLTFREQITISDYMIKRCERKSFVESVRGAAM